MLRRYGNETKYLCNSQRKGLASMMNHQSFEQSALPHMGLLRYYALHLTMDSDDANDLLQETYLKAYRFWGHFEQGTNIRAWLHSIMRNSHINQYRKESKGPRVQRFEEYHLPTGVTKEVLHSRDQKLDKSYDQAFGDEVLTSLDSLKNTFRDVVFLGDIEGCTYEEIAKALGCPMGTVRSRLHRGRKILRKKLFAYARANGYVSQDAEV
jgi:RNA polymerase sigma-70 factor (ECF subfamily)